MFNTRHFALLHFAPYHFLRSSLPTSVPATLLTTWRLSGSPFANQLLSYVVRDPSDNILTAGTGYTDASGVLAVSVDANWIGKKVLIWVENVSDDMSTAGKVHGAQVGIPS